jgi:hypothetical protein
MQVLRHNALARHAVGVWKAMYPHAIVIDGLKGIYFPIPKAGSSTIKTYICDHFAPPLKRPRSEPDFNIHSDVNYPSAPFSRLEKYQGYSRFAVVRDPLERLVSCYQEKIVQTKERGKRLRYGFERYNRLLRRELFSLDMSLEDFIRAVTKIPDAFSDEHFRSQHMFLPRNPKQNVDFFIRLEELDARLAEFTQEAGAPVWPVRIVNKSRAQNEIPLISPGCLTAFKKRYAKDYELTGYQMPSAGAETIQSSQET